jgi:iron complex transport system substrate-binding protein
VLEENTKAGSELFPSRIICMTEETTEMLYLLGEEERIVGISGFTVRPPRARKEKPKISAFTSAKIDKIMALEPDLVLGFSDLQADIASELIRRGVNVYIFNQRSVTEILSMICQLGALVGATEKAANWVDGAVARINQLRRRSASMSAKPVVYFEEWNDPLMTGIRWVAELIEIAGGIDCFPENSVQPLGKDRILADPMEVVRRSPDIIIGSWCGKKFRPEQVAARSEWKNITAVKNNHLYEIKSPLILQPGPAALTDGLDQLVQIVDTWAAEHG